MNPAPSIWGFLAATDAESRFVGEHAHPGTAWAMLFGLALILLMFGAIIALIFLLRHRARHPSDLPTSIREVVGGDEEPEAEEPEDEEDWERPDDWWKGSREE